MEPKEIGYYWVMLHPIFEQSWTIGYYAGEKRWYIHNLEGAVGESTIHEVGDKIQEPPFKQNWS